MGVRPGVPQKSHGRIVQMDLSGRKDSYGTGSGVQKHADKTILYGASNGSRCEDPRCFPLHSAAVPLWRGRPALQLFLEVRMAQSKENTAASTRSKAPAAEKSAAAPAAQAGEKRTRTTRRPYYNRRPCLLYTSDAADDSITV